MSRTTAFLVLSTAFVAGLTGLSVVASPAMAQDKPQEAVAPAVVPLQVGQGYYGPDTRDFPQTLVERIPGAAAEAARARMDLLRSHSDLTGTFRKMRFQFDRSTEFRTVADEEKVAYQAYQDARNTALSRLSQNADYRAVLELRDELGDRLESLRKVKGVKPDDLVPLAEERMNYSRTASAMESQALDEDTNVASTRDAFVAAGRKLATAKLNFEDSLRYHPDVEVARDRLADARTTNVVAATYNKRLIRAAATSIDYAYFINRDSARAYRGYTYTNDDYGYDHGYGRDFQYYGWGYNR